MSIRRLGYDVFPVEDNFSVSAAVSFLTGDWSDRRRTLRGLSPTTAPAYSDSRIPSERRDRPAEKCLAVMLLPGS